MLNKERGLHTCRALTVVKHKLNCPRQSSLLVLLPLLLNAGFALSQTVNVDASINVDVSMSNQTFEGWGTSLSWSANSVGGWTNRTNQNNLMQALFSARNGLGLTYLRYNIGGGNDPLCGAGGTHYACITPTNHATPGYEPSSGNYDWTQDANQRWVAIDTRSRGANLFEAISYSPPYWMTISGTSEGGVNGTPNLAAGYYGSGSGTFADYLTTVVKKFSTTFGIRFHHLEPLNESGQTWWPAGDTKQEGCGFDLADQEETIQNVQHSLARKKLVTQVAAMDEYQEGVLNSTTKTTAYEFYNYDSTTRDDITALNTHGYSSTVGSVAIATSALLYGKRLTESEWGSSDTSGEDLSNQILADIYLTRPTAWSIWQPDYPALMNIDYTNQAYTLNEAYYVFEQYTKFIRPGFQFIAIADPQSLAAFNQRTQTLVIVTQNWNKTARSVTYQLSSFTSLGTSVSIYQTSPTESFAPLGEASISNRSFSYTVTPHSVTTFVIQNASYTPSATTVDHNTAGTGNDLRVPSSGQSVSLRFRDLHGPVVALLCAQGAAQHFLNFLPLPQGQGSLRPILVATRGAEGFPARARRRRSMSERSSGWSGSMPTITFQWCFSQRATISSPLGIVCTRTTAGRLSDPSLAILDSPYEYRIQLIGWSQVSQSA